MSEKFEKNDAKDREIGKKLDAVNKLIKRMTKLGRAGKLRGGGGGGDVEDLDDDDDDDNASNQSAGSARMSSELVLATTAGYTDKVQGHKFETEDMEAAYNKVVADWNMGSRHNGFNVQHGHGTWGIYQESATEYRFVTSHAINVMKLILPLNLIAAKSLNRASSLHFYCTVNGTSAKKEDKYRVVLRLKHND